MKKAIGRNDELKITKTDITPSESEVSLRINFEEAQAIINNVITHINTGRGRDWSKLTAA